MATFDDVRRIALALPGVEEGTSYRTPAFKVRGKMFVRLREEDDVLVVLIEPELQPVLIEARPEVFFITPHYQGYGAVLVRLPAIDRDDLRGLIIDSWRLRAPRRLLAAFETPHAPSLPKRPLLHKHARAAHVVTAMCYDPSID
jgi:hypothetical protein